MVQKSMFQITFDGMRSPSSGRPDDQGLSNPIVQEEWEKNKIC